MNVYLNKSRTKSKKSRRVWHRTESQKCIRMGCWFSSVHWKGDHIPYGWKRPAHVWVRPAALLSLCPCFPVLQTLYLSNKSWKRSKQKILEICTTEVKYWQVVWIHTGLTDICFKADLIKLLPFFYFRELLCNHKSLVCLTPAIIFTNILSLTLPKSRHEHFFSLNTASRKINGNIWSLHWLIN